MAEEDLHERFVTGLLGSGFYTAKPHEVMGVMKEQMGICEGLRSGEVIEPENVKLFLMHLASLKMNATSLLSAMCEQVGVAPEDIEDEVIAQTTGDTVAEGDALPEDADPLEPDTCTQCGGEVIGYHYCPGVFE